MDKIFFTFNIIDALPGQVPDWIQLTPAGEFVSVDGRGPFVADEAAILAAAKERKLPVDINHAIDLKGTARESSPAVGWVVELQSRGDGIWGRVEWTAAGKNALLNKEYGAISPVLIAQGERPARVVKIARASLCNDPALPQLKSLFSEKICNRHGETSMDKQLLAAMGLPEEADEKALIAAVAAVKEESGKAAALMSHLREVAGLGSQAGDDEVIALVKEKFTANATANANADVVVGQEGQAADEEKSEMARQIADLNAKLVEITLAHAREKAERFVKQAIERFQIMPSLREHFIARHMREPELVEKEIAAQPALMSAALKEHVQDKGGNDGLSSDERRLCHLMGIDAKKFAETKKAKNEELV